MKFREEWKITVPWGKLVLCRWGDPKGEPVLMIHGRQDSAAVFRPLLEMMPQNYHFVALDMPGNGLSDPFPLDRDAVGTLKFPHYVVMCDSPPMPRQPFIDFYNKIGFGFNNPLPGGPKLTRFHFLAAMEFAIKHLGWKKFHFIGHSMGCEQVRDKTPLDGLLYKLHMLTGLFYNAIHPNQIMKMILLDAGPTLIRMQVESLEEFQRSFFETYYENYDWETGKRKPITRHKAMTAMRRRRGVSFESAFLLIERNFETNDPGVLQSWEEANQNENKAGASNEARNKDDKQYASQEYTNQLVRDYIRENDLCKDQGKPPELNEVVEHMRDNDAEGFLSWDNRLKNLAPTNFGNDYYYELFKTIPPTLFIVASEGTKNASPNLEYHRKAKELMQRMSKLDNYYQIDVEGSHDVHFSNPERVVPYIIQFLGQNFKGFSKL